MISKKIFHDSFEYIKQWDRNLQKPKSTDLILKDRFENLAQDVKDLDKSTSKPGNKIYPPIFVAAVANITTLLLRFY
jgi:hypothetical protein